MPALREIIASYEIQVDGTKKLTHLTHTLREVSDQVEDTGKKLKASLSLDQVANALTVAGAAVLGFSALTVKMASDVEETNNVVRETFKGSAKEIFDWSVKAGAAMQRSEFDLQRYAGNVGAFLSPVFKDTGADIAGMSRQVAELAVDLASFYNLNDQEAMLALQSGLSGETEAVRRFGINLADERLSVMNKEVRGSEAIYKNLGLREKTELRLRAIMIDTVDKQGDAVRTADSWANQMKGLEADYKKIAVSAGEALLPIALEHLETLRDWVKPSEETATFMEKHARSVESAAGFIALSLVGVKAITLASTGLLAPVAAWVAALLVGFAVVDDIRHALKGEDSFLGGKKGDKNYMPPGVRTIFDDTQVEEKREREAAKSRAASAARGSFFRLKGTPRSEEEIAEEEEANAVVARMAAETFEAKRRLNAPELTPEQRAVLEKEEKATRGSNFQRNDQIRRQLGMGIWDAEKNPRALMARLDLEEAPQKAIEAGDAKAYYKARTASQGAPRSKEEAAQWQQDYVKGRMEINVRNRGVGATKEDQVDMLKYLRDNPEAPPTFSPSRLESSVSDRQDHLFSSMNRSNLNNPPAARPNLFPVNITINGGDPTVVKDTVMEAIQSLAARMGALSGTAAQGEE